MNSEQAIEVTDLKKYYDDFPAVNGISFSVERGDFFGFLGPNGAGKTTTVRVLTGILPPTAGEARVMGYDIEKSAPAAKEQLGVVPETVNTYPDLTPRENLWFSGRMYGMDSAKIEQRSSDLLQEFGLGDVEDVKTKEFSKGMRQRVALCGALLHEPQLLFLDEPTSGLDVQSARLIRTIISELNETGVTIYLMTHNIEEANRLCDRVAVINNGRIAAIDSPENLRADIQSTRSVEVVFAEAEDSPVPVDDLKGLPEVEKVEGTGKKFRIFSGSLDPLIKALSDYAAKHEREIVSLNTLDPSLEDAFVRLTGDSTAVRKGTDE